MYHEHRGPVFTLSRSSYPRAVAYQLDEQSAIRTVGDLAGTEHEEVNDKYRVVVKMNQVSTKDKDGKRTLRFDLESSDRVYRANRAGRKELDDAIPKDSASLDAALMLL